ncbi:MAG TPA: Gfo/Idh/MocA family oxidoreductase [bacterium]|nr:Gfo/Idh/MocA family oxidoreductase [bacterium]
MARQTVGIIMNGVTGRMGTNQHLARSIMAIRGQGGVALADGDVIWPEPILVGRDSEKLAALAGRFGLERWSTDLDACLGDPAAHVYFDAQVTSARAEPTRRAIRAGKHVYVEKPLAEDLETGLDLVRLARTAGVRTGIVQDKLFLPGIRKLRRLVDGGFFGRVLAVRGEFGYWVFEGDWQPSQRPSWNYRTADGGGIIADMFPHWCYVLERLVGPVRRVVCAGATHIPRRVDERGETYAATADDAAYAIFEAGDGIVVQFNSSWCVRVYRDELLSIQVDGTDGSAVAGLWTCRTQHRANTPRAVWNPDEAPQTAYRQHWLDVPDNEPFDNAFKVQWEFFLRHVARDEPFPWSFPEGAKGLQLAEAGMRSWREGRWIEVPALAL